ncbi:MAG: rfaE1 [Deltaproteobacteria bacterium]|nr:rfaE1 [Deltaproteobacteria bacterium]
MSDAGILSRAAEVVRRFPSRRVLVVGDIMLDEYVFGTVGRISPEAPVPVVAVTRETKVPGGAANVAFNLRGLGAGVEMAGFLGDDAEGRFVARMLRGKRVGLSSVVVDPERPTTVKTRVIAHSQQVVRVDREQKAPPSRKASDTLLRRVLAVLAGVDGVVFSDYQKGALTGELVREVTAAANRKGIFVAVDPKRSDFSFYRGCTVITPNKGEAQAALGGRELANDLDVWEAAKVLLRSCRSKAVLITRGEEGMTLVERGRGLLPCPRARAAGVRRHRRGGHGDRDPGRLPRRRYNDARSRGPRQRRRQRCRRGGRHRADHRREATARRGTAQQ